MAVLRNVVGIPATPIMLQIRMRGSVPTSNGGTRILYNIFNYNQVALVPILEDMVSLLTDFETNVANVVALALNVDYTALALQGRWLDDPSFGWIDGPVPDNGAITGERLPLFNTAVVQLKSDNRGRSYNGSKHFAPISESDSNDDQLVAGAITRFTTVATGLIQDLTGSGGSLWSPVILSTTLSNLTANPSIFTFSTLSASTGYVVNSTVGTMKRRKQRPT